MSLPKGGIFITIWRIIQFPIPSGGGKGVGFCPRKPKTDTAEEQEHIHAIVAAAHQPVEGIAARKGYVEEHHDDHRKAH